MTTAFYAPPASVRDGRVLLPDDETRHAVRALRKEAGDEIIVVDGTGGWYRVRLDRVGDRRAAGTVLETRREVGEPAYRLTIGFGLIKNRNRFETFVEKAVELGVHAIIPLHTARTEKEGIKTERTRNIMIAAMKQSGRCRLPTLADPASLPAVLDRRDAFDTMLIAHEEEAATSTIRAALEEAPAEAHVCVLVGPEGGFNDGEVDRVIRAGGQAVTLGPRRLRAETAGIAVAAVVHDALG